MSVTVTTKSPTVGKQITVVVRFAPQFDLLVRTADAPSSADDPWVNGEVAVIPLDRADAHGWPLRPSDLGTAVRLHRTGGEYRGSFTMRRGGWYVLFDRSSEIAHKDGMIVNGLLPQAYAAPVKLFIAHPATLNHAPSKHSSRGLATALLLFGLVGFGVALPIARRPRVDGRTPRSGVSLVGTPSGEAASDLSKESEVAHASL